VSCVSKTRLYLVVLGQDEGGGGGGGQVEINIFVCEVVDDHCTRRAVCFCFHVGIVRLVEIVFNYFGQIFEGVMAWS